MTSPIGKNYYRRGDHNSVSDISGQKFKRSQLRRNWKNQLVAEDEYEPKQPQLTLRGRKETIAVTNGTRTQAADGPLIDPPFDASTGAI